MVELESHYSLKEMEIYKTYQYHVTMLKRDQNPSLSERVEVLSSYSFAI